MWKWGRIIQDPVRWKHLEDVVDGLSPLLPHLKGLENGDHASSAFIGISFRPEMISELISRSERSISRVQLLLFEFLSSCVDVGVLYPSDILVHILQITD
jgi:hypothetical protein